MIPEKFKERMQLLLGDEYGSFISALEDEKSIRGVRVNRLKYDPESFFSESALPLAKIHYCPDGFILESDEPVGSTPEHHAGIIYMQDPGAMASLSALDVEKGSYVLDMCAAPGGKSGQAAAAIGEEGFLLANEYVPKRAKITVANFERLGIKNAYVTSLDTGEFKKLFSDYFDLVIADVPCSGEGMFRKSSEALSNWSEENVRISAGRQREILENAHSLVKPGGHIIYSTCTYSLEENEMNVYAFLTAHPEFELCEVKEELRLATCDGVSFRGKETDVLKRCRRFYPHASRGEGQFMALLCKKKGEGAPRVLFKEKVEQLSREERRIAEAFLSDVLLHAPDARLQKVGDNIYLMPKAPAPPRSVFMSGVLLGEIRKGILTPSHQFFSAYGSDFKRKYELSDSQDIAEKYLFGEEIENAAQLPNGFCVMTYRGAALGGGKAVGERIKNHYPKGLRNNRA